MQPAVTLTIASVGLLIVGSGTSSTRMSPGAWIVVARMRPILHGPHRARGVTRLARLARDLSYLISEIPCSTWRRTTRVASATSSATPASTAASPSTSSPSCSAPARARSTGSRRATRTSRSRCWRASAPLSTPRSSRSAPAPRTCASPARRRCPGSIEVKTSKNAGVALLCASLLNRGRTTLRKVARIEEVNRLLEVLSSPRRRRPAGSTTRTTSRSSRRPSSTSTTSTRTRPAAPAR